MEILMIPTYIIMARVFALMLLILFASGKLASSLKNKYGDGDIMKKIISVENILSLSAYLILLYVLSFIWPLGWEVFNMTSGVFWPVQGLIILAIVGWVCLEKLRFLPWFFLTMAIILTVTGLMRDPRIYYAEEKKPAGRSEESVPPRAQEPVESHEQIYNPQQASQSRNDNLSVEVPAGDTSKRVITQWGYENELSEESDHYLIQVKAGFQFRAKALDSLRLVLSNGSYVDYGPNDYVSLSDSRLNGKIFFVSLNNKETKAIFTIEPQK